MSQRKSVRRWFGVRSEWFELVEGYVYASGAEVRELSPGRVSLSSTNRSEESDSDVQVICSDRQDCRRTSVDGFSHDITARDDGKSNEPVSGPSSHADLIMKLT